MLRKQNKRRAFQVPVVFTVAAGDAGNYHESAPAKTESQFRQDVTARLPWSDDCCLGRAPPGVLDVPLQR